MAQTYTLAQLYQLAVNAGFRGAAAVTAAAIAMAESGGNPTSYNPETQAGTAPGMGSYGLWQVYLTDHPQYSASYLDTPQGSANAAFAIYQAAGNSFSPWSTYKSGAYRQYLAPTIAATGGLSTGWSPTITSAIGAIPQANVPAAIANALNVGVTDATTALHSVGWFVLALAIVIFGAWLLFEPQIDQATQAVQGAAGKAADVAALAA